MTSQKPLALPKPKEHGAWGMLYIPFMIAVGITRIFDLRILLLLLAVTFVFLSQRPLTQFINARESWFSLNSWRWNLIWLGLYCGASAILFAVLFFYYQLVFLFWFGLIGIPVGGTFLFLLKQNRGRTVLGELVGILGLTMTAPLVHSVAVGRIQPMGFWIWGLSFLYFSSSIFYVKATVQDFVRAKTRARMTVGQAVVEGVPRPLPFMKSSERFDPILPRSEDTGNASGASNSSVAYKLLAFKEPYEFLSTRQLCRGYHWGLLILVGTLVISQKLPILTLWAFAPVIVRGLWEPRTAGMRLNLRRIGWLEVTYSIIFALFTIWAMRLETFAR